MIARNLLGRLNARTPDDLQRIAGFWLVPLPGADRARHVGALYRAMTGIRQARSAWDRLDPEAQVIVRELAAGEAGALTVDGIAALTGQSPPVTREAAIRLFQAGILAREGDNQELPVGALPRLFLPREVGQVFRRVQDEIDAGDLSGSALRVMMEMLDDAELEEAAGIWGIRVIPGQRRRSDLVSQILRQIAVPDRVSQVVAGRGRHASAIWEAVRADAPNPMALDEAVRRAGLGPLQPVAPDYLRVTVRIEAALSELEEALLVFHTYRRDGSRWLFVPHEIANPGEAAKTMPLRPLQPLPPEKAPRVPEHRRHALAWDLLTVLREIVDHGAPVWEPGEPLARAWQRRLNRRLWVSGDEIPPRGYLGFLLYLGVAVDVIVPAAEALPAGADKSAIRPVVAATVREWTRLSFAAQEERLRAAWQESEAWVEGREREEIEVWGADWRGFRHKMGDAIDRLDPGEWLMTDDLGARLAEQDPTLIGATFTAASARAVSGVVDERNAAVAQVVEIELETALAWFGIVQVGVVPRAGLAVRRVAPEESPDPTGPSLAIDQDGLVTLLRPAPLHVWSLSAFADAERLRPAPEFQLRPGSVSRALGAGFGLEQITAYLEAQSGAPLPDALARNLRDWTVGYRRVRMRRAMVLNPDNDEAIPAMRDVLTAAGVEVLPQLTPEGDLIVLLPLVAEGAASPEDELLAILRAHGYAGQWERPPSPPRS